MFDSKFSSLVGGVVFLLITLAALYRLMVGFPITIGTFQVGQVSTFFVFVIGAALTIISFQGMRTRGD